MKIAYLGPAGTYSQEAAFKAFGANHTPIFCASLAEVVSEVGNKADGAVLPIENSTNGVVELAVDALIGSQLKNFDICGEVKVHVRHQLFTPAQSLDSIKTVYSHPQVWGQVRKWLMINLPNAKCVNTSSTAEAVRQALASNDPSVAAFGGPLTSNVPPLVANCADDPQNTTRFLKLLSKSSTNLDKNHTNWKIVMTSPVSGLHTQIAECRVVPLFIAARPSSTPWVYNYLVEYETPTAKL